MDESGDRTGQGPVTEASWPVRLLRGRPQDPRWARPALAALLAGTALLYLWGLGASGWANPFYSAAAQAGATSWKAFFFGSSDAANAITVDKTPAALWPMALAARVFGVNSWSILVPQALMGVAAVGVLYTTVRRSLSGGVNAPGDGRVGSSAGPAAAGLLAGAALATTPVAALMFRFNNPDALLVLLLTLGAYGLVRAQLGGGGRWLVFAAVCVGTGFMAKMLQAFLVVPAFALVYLVTAPGPLRRRLARAALAGAALLVAACWWVAVVAVVPAGSRPYIGGSQHDSVVELALGYNGLGRLTGEEVGGLGNLNQDTGWGRLLGGEIGGQVSWLLPAALIMLVAGLWLTRRAPRTDPARAGYLLWGGWLLTTALIFSFMQGIFHAYYTVALAPPIAALTGMGSVSLWHRRRHPAAALTLALTVAATAWWSYHLLGRTADWNAWLGPVVLTTGLVAAVVLAAVSGWRHRPVVAAPGAGAGERAAAPTTGRMSRAAAGVAAGAAIAASAAGPAAYALQTAGTPHGGAIPSAGPAGGFGPGGLGRPGGRGGGTRGPGGAFAGGGGPGGFPGNVPGNIPGNIPGNGAAPGTAGGTGGAGPGGQTRAGAWQSFARRGRPPGGGPGGLLGATTPSAELTALLRARASSYTWVAAAVGSNNAAGYRLATGAPVMAVGGFNGTDPAPTLNRFQQYVTDKKIHYFIGGSLGRRAQSGSDQSVRIAEWVQQNFTAQTVGGVTVYDLTAPRS